MKNLAFRKILLFIIAAIVTLTSNHSFSGDKVGNGGGIAEQNITFAFLNLKTILNICLSSSNCLTSVDQKKDVQKIVTSLNKEYSNQVPLKFLSGALHPEIFIINGTIRTAVTGDNVADTICINTDLIYFDKSKSIQEPMSIASAMGLLTHELGHHHKIINHDYLDLIGAQIKAFALSSMDILKTDTYMELFDVSPPSLVASAVHANMISGSSIDGAETTLLFADEMEVLNLKPWLDKALNVCPASSGLPTGKTLGYRLYNIKWGRWTMKGPVQSKRYYQITADVSLYCEQLEDLSYPLRFNNSNELLIELPVSQMRHPRLKNYGWILQTPEIKLTLRPISN